MAARGRVGILDLQGCVRRDVHILDVSIVRAARTGAGGRHTYACVRARTRSSRVTMCVCVFTRVAVLKFLSRAVSPSLPDVSIFRELCGGYD